MYFRKNYRSCHVILFDGRCSLCVRSVKFLLCFDWFNMFLCLDFRQDDVLDLIKCVSLNQLENEMVLITNHGQIKSGYIAWRYIVNKLPIFFLMSLLLYFPLVTRIGNWLYSLVARSRMGLVHCPPGDCVVHKSANTSTYVIEDIDILSVNAIKIANSNM